MKCCTLTANCISSSQGGSGDGQQWHGGCGASARGCFIATVAPLGGNCPWRRLSPAPLPWVAVAEPMNCPWLWGNHHPRAPQHPAGWFLQAEESPSPTGDPVPFGRGMCHSYCALRAACLVPRSLHGYTWLCRMKELPFSCVPDCHWGSPSAISGPSGVSRLPTPCGEAHPHAAKRGCCHIPAHPKDNFIKH